MQKWHVRDRFHEVIISAVITRLFSLIALRIKGNVFGALVRDYSVLWGMQDGWLDEVQVPSKTQVEV